MESSWAHRRKRLFLIIFIIIGLIFISVFYYLFFYSKPSCSDGKQNQNEKGIDCGGICNRMCEFDFSEPVVLWHRAFEVQPGAYAIVALVRNQNIKAEDHSREYIIKAYDISNNLITQRTGTTFIPPNQNRAIFESGISTMGKTINRVEFEFTDEARWVELPSVDYYPTVSVKQSRSFDVSTAPRLEVDIVNNSKDLIEKAESVVILYNAQNVAVGASRTVFQQLGPNQVKKLFFTWPRPWSDAVVRQELITHVYPEVLLR